MATAFFIPADSGGGGGVTGDPNAIGYFNPLGTALIDDIKLTAAPVDQFGRPQILDRRLGALGEGPVLRQGGWTADGDPVNQIGEGIVSYGPANGLQDAANGMIGRVKYDRFQLRRIVGGVDIGSAFRVDPTHLFLTSDLNVMTAEILRATGAAFFGSVRTGGSTGALWNAGNGSPETVVTGSPGDLYSNTSGGAGTTLYVKESGVATNTGWVAYNQLPLFGTTAARPVGAPTATPYLDTDLGFTIWALGATWIDAAGVVV